MSKNIDIADTVGGRLRLERKRLGLTQAALAAELGLHRLTQANYESGSTEPPASYLRSLRRLGMDDVFIQSGVKAEPGRVQSNATERLLLALCDALQMPVERVNAAILAASKGEGHAEFRGHLNALLHTSLVLNREHKILELDRDALVDIIDSLERHLSAIGKHVSPLQKAHAIASLYRIFAEKGQVDAAMIEGSARSMPTI